MFAPEPPPQARKAETWVRQSRRNGPAESGDLGVLEPPQRARWEQGIGCPRAAATGPLRAGIWVS